MPTHNPGLSMMGAAMLWVGWFGFNAGSALAADTSAGMAMLVTHISAATASLVWVVIEWIKFGKPSLVGVITGMVAGLATRLVLAFLLGTRKGFPTELRPPHNPGLSMIGAAMLWVGWFGFNAGSALAADTSAGMAMLVTHISAATASLVWVVIEWIKFGKPSLVGVITGMVAGLATITPASGFVGPLGGLCIGLAGGLVCYWGVGLVKSRWKIDDSLDVFAVHGIGGMLGTMLTAVFAIPVLGGGGLAEGVGLGGQLVTQGTGVVATVVWSAVATFVIVKVTSAVVGLRVSDDDITQGLDVSAHGESGYSL